MLQAPSSARASGVTFSFTELHLTQLSLALLTAHRVTLSIQRKLYCFTSSCAGGWALCLAEQTKALRPLGPGPRKVGDAQQMPKLIKILNQKFRLLWAVVPIEGWCNWKAGKPIS